jgi:hypothetical protein
MIEFVLLLAAGALVLLVVAALLARRNRFRRSSAGVRSLERDDSIGYFRDLSGRGSARGVQEEDRTGRWGAGDGR